MDARPSIRLSSLSPYLLYAGAAVALWLFGVFIVCSALVGALSMFILRGTKRII